MDLIDPSDSLERQNEKLMRITEALIKRAEQSPDQAGMAYAQFERAALLEEQVRQRTADLERTLDLLHESNAHIAIANKEAEVARGNLAEAIETIDEGFALFDSDDRLVLFNSRFCLDLPDVRRPLAPGTDFQTYVRLVSESAALDWSSGETPDDWLDTRLKLHRKDHVVFNVRLLENRWLQVSEHRTGTRGTVILQTDVTEIMRLERRERDKLVNQQALMLRATLDHLNQGVCIFDRDNCLVGWNQQMERLLERPIGDQFRGLRFEDLMVRLERVFLFQRMTSDIDLLEWAASRAGRAPLSFEVRTAGDLIYSVFAQEMPDRGFVFSFTDITEERQTSDALRELNGTLERRVIERTIEVGKALDDARRANASKTRFVAAASHDLLQPMSAAKLYASALEDRLPNPEDRALVHKTTSALASAEAIIGALMDISKLDLGLAVFEVAPVNLGSILQALADEFAPIAASKSLDLRVIPAQIRVESDGVYLHRIIQNIISNAVRYTTGRKILVGVRRVGRAARIEVWDQGPGIAEADQKRIFQEFQQLGPNSGGSEGLGLGLAIVERACKMLGHQLHLWSEPGVGTCFSILIDSAVASAPSTTDQPHARAGRTDGLVVGLVENDEDLAQSISLVVEAFGSEVVHFPSAEEALELIEDMGIVPDCFLLDYQLGDGMSGVDLVPQLRARYGDVPMEIISADRSTQLLSACRTLGVRLRHKPLSRDNIGAFLSRVPRGEGL